MRQGDLEAVRSEVSRIAGRRALSGLRAQRLGVRGFSDLLRANRVEGLAAGAGVVWRVPGDQRHVMNRRYVLVSPCRDEAEYMRRTLDSVLAQSTPPSLWIVVDDGSTDDTPAILESYRSRMPYLKVVRRENRGRRSVGPGVIETFYAGLETIALGEFDYVCKLDLDLDLPPRYFELLMERMEANPRLGTSSGKPYFVSAKTGKLVAEVCGDENSAGMTKFYRVQCFREIGGFVRQVMWDGIDCHRCRLSSNPSGCAHRWIASSSPNWSPKD